MEEPVPDPEPEPEPEPKVEDIKPEIEEKVLEEREEKAPSPVPVESPQNIQEPPKVKLVSFPFITILNSLDIYVPSERTMQNFTTDAAVWMNPNDALLYSPSRLSPGHL